MRWLLLACTLCSALLLVVRAEAAAPLWLETARSAGVRVVTDPAHQSASSARAQALLDEALLDLEQGNVAEAEARLDGARQAHPDDVVLERWHCLTLIESHQFEAATELCQHVVQRSSTPLDRWAMVRASLGHRPSVTFQQFSALAHHAAMAQRRAPDEVWGWSAQCQLAHAIADAHLIKECLSQLQTVAPDHPEARRIRSALGVTSPLGYGLGWGFIGLLALWTLLHRSWRPTRVRHRVAHGTSSLLLLTLGMSLWASPSHAQRDTSEEASQRRVPFVINPDDPESSVPPPSAKTQDPMRYAYFVMQLSAAADGAYDSGEYETALRYYRAIVKAAPDHAAGYRQLCATHEALEQIPQALEACATVLGVPGGQLDDYTRYVNLKLTNTQVLTPLVIDEITEIITHLRKEKAPPMTIASIECELGARSSDQDLLRRCVPLLLDQADENPRILTYQWTLALLQGDQAKAERLMEQARRSSLEEPGLRAMEAAMAKTSGSFFQRNWFVLLLALLALLVLGRLLRDRAIESRLSKNQA